MSRINSGTIGSRYIAIISFGYAGALFLQTIWVGRFYGSDSLAAFSIVAGLFAPLLSFLSSGQRFSVLTSKLLDENSLVNNSAIRVGAILILSLGFFIYHSVFAQDASRIIEVFLFYAGYKVFDSLFELVLWDRQIKSDVFGYLVFGFGRVFIIPLTCVLSYFFDFDFSLFLLFCFFVSSVVFFVFSLFFYRGSDFYFSYRGMVSAFSSAGLAGSAAAIESLSVVFPRFVLAFMGNLGNVAAYTIFNQISIAIGIFASATIQADMPRFSSESTNKKKMFSVFLKRFIFLVLFSSLIFFSVPGVVFGWVFGEWFVGYYHVIYFVPVVCFFSYASGYLANMQASNSSGRFLLLYSFSFLILIVFGGAACWGAGGGVLFMLSVLLLSYVVRFCFIYARFLTESGGSR